MKCLKKFVFLGIIIAIVAVVCLGFGYQKSPEPNVYYEVYLKDKSLGVIASKDELDDYINTNGSYYKNKYGVNEVYSPTDLQMKKITTYNDKVSSVRDVYKQISKDSNFTIKGYEFKIKKQTTNDDGSEETSEKTIYVLDKKVFKKAIEALIETFVGKDRYEAYLDDNQVKIETTGENIENVYIDEDITFKETNISVNEKIYTDADELARYLLYGNDYNTSDYTVSAGDTIDNVAFNNQVSPEELLLSNPTLTSTTNLLYPGQKLTIAETNPQISVVEETYVVEDIESQYTTEERYDDTMVVGQDKVIQEGENGMDRVSQMERKINGTIVYVDPKGKESLKSSVTKIIVKGSKVIPDVGSTTSWGWPTDSGWTLSSGYVWRTSPINGKRELHGGLDISGTGYGSNIYATNNGRVIEAGYHYSYGNHVIINHNNGYYTLYGHMSRIAVKVGDVVSRGQVIGYVGMTGAATGPHVHYEIWKGCEYCRINPMSVY